MHLGTLSVWFQAAECNAVNASLSLNLINNNFLTFLNENLPILNPYLPPKSENWRPHYSHSSWENATPSSDTSPLASCEGVPPTPRNFHLQLDIDQTSSGDFGIHNSTFFLLIKLQVTTIFVTKIIFQYTRRASACKHPVVTEILQKVTTIFPV